MCQTIYSVKSEHDRNEDINYPKTLSLLSVSVWQEGQEMFLIVWPDIDSIKSDTYGIWICICVTRWFTLKLAKLTKTNLNLLSLFTRVWRKKQAGQLAAFFLLVILTAGIKESCRVTIKPTTFPLKWPKPKLFIVLFLPKEHKYICLIKIFSLHVLNWNKKLIIMYCKIKIYRTLS